MNDMILSEVNRLYQHFGATSKDVTKEMLQAQLEIASSFPGTLVRRVVDKFIQGKIDGQSFDFPPKPPLFAKALRMEPFSPQEQLAKREVIRREMEAEQALLAEPKRDEPDAASKARVAAMLAAFKAQTQANREAERKAPVKEPMTPEKAEYWRKISSLPDAAKLTEEHHAMRRKVMREVEQAVSEEGRDAA